MGQPFFQAEDGIRDRDVTGVQTCALPICQHQSDKLDRRTENSERVDLGGRRIIKKNFFQAEDGIRDRDVTGVQTCALPI